MISGWGLNPDSVEALGTVAGFVAATLAIRQVDRHQHQRFVEGKRRHAELFTATPVRPLTRSGLHLELIRWDLNLYNGGALPVRSLTPVLHVYDKSSMKLMAGQAELPETEGLKVAAFGPGKQVHYRSNHRKWWEAEMQAVVMADLGWGSLGPSESMEVSLTVNEHVAVAAKSGVGVRFVDGDGSSWVRYLDGHLCPGHLSELRRH